MLGKTRKALVGLLIAIGCVSFFLPLISINAPIIGSIQWSTLDLITEATGYRTRGPALADIGNDAADRDTSGAAHRTTVPLGVSLLRFLPIELAVAYAMLILAIVALVIRPFEGALRLIAVFGSIASGAALVSVFLFANAVRQNVNSSVSGSGESNPFAALGQALARSLRIEPSVGLYLLVGVMIALFVVVWVDSLDRLTIVEKQSAPASGS